MTPRPGRLAEIIDVPFERPRQPALQLTTEFNQLVARVRSVLGGH